MEKKETEDGTRRGGVGAACGPSDVLPIKNQKITDESGDHFQNWFGDVVKIQGSRFIYWLKSFTGQPRS